MKHTTGPWKHAGPVGHGQWITAGDSQIAVVYGSAVTPESDANTRLIVAAPDQYETLRADAAFLRHYLENYIVSVQVKDERGYVVNSFAAVQIPDWAVKQRLDDIDAAIAKAEGRL